MRPVLSFAVLLIGLAVPSQAVVIADTYTPVSPQKILIRFGTTTLIDGLQLPAFDFSFSSAFLSILRTSPERRHSGWIIVISTRANPPRRRQSRTFPRRR